MRGSLGSMTCFRNPAKFPGPALALFEGFDGPRVVPGEYRARVTIGELSETVSFAVAQDPRLTATDEQIQEWAARLADVRALMTESLLRLDEARAARDRIEELMSRYPDAGDLRQAGESAIERIGTWEAEINQMKHETYEDEDAWESKLAAQLRYLLDVIDDTGAPVTDGAMRRLADLRAEWATRERELADIVATDIRAVNAWAHRNDVEHVPLPQL
jgi:hypothetical protein